MNRGCNAATRRTSPNNINNGTRFELRQTKRIDNKNNHIAINIYTINYTPKNWRRRAIVSLSCSTESTGNRTRVVVASLQLHKRYIRFESVLQNRMHDYSPFKDVRFAIYCINRKVVIGRFSVMFAMEIHPNRSLFDVSMCISKEYSRLT